jgi:lipopolysaccharide/colanic/teichoic acid biosynthesis glycosyltransferase
MPSSPIPRWKRVLDVTGAAVGLVAAVPLGAVIAAAIWLEDGRPLFFTQTRCGKDGARFSLHKFRSLSTGPKDRRRPGDHATRVGRVLRRWGLDELPQLWNVLCGDMSLVGPRPVPPHQVEAYGDYERIRLRVRPGLTGWAQIHGRNALSWPERIERDVWYVRHRSLALDLRILLRTPAVLLRGTGTYGPDGRNPSFQKGDEVETSAIQNPKSKTQN